MTHSFCTFHIIVPEEEDKKTYEINVGFKNMIDVQKGKVFQGKYCVAPVWKLRHPEQSLMLIQMHHQFSSPFTFDPIRDKKAFEIISKIISSIIEKIQVYNKTSQTHDRVYRIL